MSKSDRKIKRTVKLAKELKRAGFAFGGFPDFSSDIAPNYSLDNSLFTPTSPIPKGMAFSPVHILSSPSSDIKVAPPTSKYFDAPGAAWSAPKVSTGLMPNQQNYGNMPNFFGGGNKAAPIDQTPAPGTAPIDTTPAPAPSPAPAPVDTSDVQPSGVSFAPPAPPPAVTFTAPDYTQALSEPSGPGPFSPAGPMTGPTDTPPLAQMDLYKGAPVAQADPNSPFNPPPPAPAPDPTPVADTGPSNDGPCCFDPDAPVLMEDGAYKRIADVVVGDKVTGLNGRINTVIGTKTTTVGSRKMMQFENHEFYSTDDHLFLTDKGWKTWVPSRLVDNNRENAVFLVDENRTTPLNDDDKMLFFVDGMMFARQYNSYKVQAHDFPADFVVHDLHLDGDQTYIISGFIVHNCGSCCFDKNAPVVMADGSRKAISEIVLGDEVLNSKQGTNKVVGLKSTIVGKRKMIKFSDHDFFATDDHLFLTDKGWKTWQPSRLIDGKYENAALLDGKNREEPLARGDKMVMIDSGGVTEVPYAPAFMEFHDFDPDEKVYDLHLDGDHTYVVDGFIVHNCGQDSQGGAITMRRYKAEGGPIKVSPAQREAGNYKKEHLNIHGIPLSVEVKKGEIREKTKDNGEVKWKMKMPSDYGYVRDTVDTDAMQTDAFIGPDHASKAIWIVDQYKKNGKKFDEHKSLIGFKTKSEAMKAYNDSFTGGKKKKDAKHVTEMTPEEYKHWLKHGNKKIPVSSDTLIQKAIGVVSKKK